MQWGIDVITTIVLLFLIFVGTLYLETKLTAFFQFEVIVVILGIIGAIILLFGEATKKRWTWPFSSIYHSLALGNLALLFVWTNSYGVALISILIALAALLRSFAKIDEQEWEAQLEKEGNFNVETYDNDKKAYANRPEYEPVIHADAVIAPKKKTTRKRSTRKKATRRKAAKKTSRKKSRKRRR